MNKIKGNFSTKAIKEEIKKLEKELKKLEEYNASAWQMYGSELCAGEMIGKENELENKIKKLKEKLKWVILMKWKI